MRILCHEYEGKTTLRACCFRGLKHALRSSGKQLLIFLLALLTPCNVVLAGRPWRFIMPEERHLALPHPTQLPRVPIPNFPKPPTVSQPRLDAPPRDLSLDEAIRISLTNSEVIRVLGGVTAVSSGRTIYDVPATSTTIDLQRGRFDPDVTVGNNWNRLEAPIAFSEDPNDPFSRTLIGGTRTDNYSLNFELGKTTTTGGRIAMQLGDNLDRFQPGIFRLTPQERHALDLRITQPLLQGGGRAANLAPIVLAQIDTQRSFFQFKGSMQEMVRGVIQAYWALVFSRTNLWARQQQVKQSQFAFDLTTAQEDKGISSGGDVAQARLALANFRASLVSAKADVLQREAALLNILGLPPYAPDRMTPVTPPTKTRLDVDWEQVVEMAEQYRPDLIELKLILEADQQLLLQANNQALPRIDAVALYRWNGLEGQMPNGGHVSSLPGQHTDWTLGVNFS
ncbi:MAG: TolC family protein, partial [Pirellulales bacterium]